MINQFVMVLLASLVFHNHGLAIINGYTVKNEALNEKIVLIDSRENDRSTVCTASVISKNKILSASHCVNHLSRSDNLSCIFNCSSKILLNGVSEKFRVYKHPYYQNKSNQPDYTENTNFDLVIIEFPNKVFKKKFKLDFDFTNKERESSQVKFYGRGMSQLQRSLSSIDQYSEFKRGPLRSGKGVVHFSAKGLGSTKSSLLKSYKRKKNSKFIYPEESQVLRSDSGGPLVANGKIIGITRNYSFHERIISNQTNLYLKSYFTLISNTSTKRFIQNHLK